MAELRPRGAGYEPSEEINVTCQKCSEDANKQDNGSDLKAQIKKGELPSLSFQGEFEVTAKNAQVGVQGEKTNGRFVYPQWSFVSQDYLVDWCKVKEFNLPPAENVPALQSVKQQRQLAQLFERAYPSAAVKRKKQLDGEIDIDAVVEFVVDRKAGNSPVPKVYVDRRKQLAGIAAAFLIDASPSALKLLADGRKVIDAERESLELLIAGMKQAGHTYGVFGFSGWERSDVRIYVVKNFDEAFDRSRLYSLEPRPINDEHHESSVVTTQNSPIMVGTYTGPAIRHLTRILTSREETQRLLIVLTDSDHRANGYIGEYARADVNMAFLEAKAKDVHPLAISFSCLAKEKLAKSYGRHFIEVSRPEELVQKLPQVYIALMH